MAREGRPADDLRRRVYEILERGSPDDLDIALAGHYTRQRNAAVLTRGVGRQQKVRHFRCLSVAALY